MRKKIKRKEPQKNDIKEKHTRAKKEDSELTYFDLIRKDMTGFVQMSEIEEVSIVPTILTGYNRATGRGGHPLGRMVLIHGPNQVGKSCLALAILESLARAGFPAFNEDAEFAVEKRWYNHICTTPGILDKGVGDLDEVVRDVNTAISKVEMLQKDGKMPRNIGVAFVVDTLSKLMPKDIIEIVKKEGIEKMYPIQTLHISVWMKVVIPLLGKTNSSLIVVLQERENIDKKNPFDRKWKMTLGTAIQYDNCLRIRVTGNEKVKGSDDAIVGMQCFCEVQNNKVDGTTLSDFSFFTANGSGDCPIGLDLVMGDYEEAKGRGWIKKVKKEKESVMMLTFSNGDECVLGNNGPDAIRFLRANSEVHARLTTDLNDNCKRVVKECSYES